MGPSPGSGQRSVPREPVPRPVGAGNRPLWTRGAMPGTQPCRAGGDVGAETRQLLRALYWVTGRRDEVRNMLQGEVEQLRNPSEPLRMLWNLDHDPYPIDRMTRSLEQARKAAPDDDRVWLALADLATRVGRFRRGRRLAHALRAGSARRRRSLARRLRWSRAAGRPDEVVRARGPLAAVKLDAVRLARIPCLDGRTTRRPPRRAIGPRIVRHPRAGQCRGLRAPRRPGRAVRRKGAVRRIATPEGGHPERARSLRATDH